MNTHRISWLMSVGPAQMDLPEDKVREQAEALSRMPGVVNLTIEMLDNPEEN